MTHTHLVYMMSIGGQPYVGKTAGHRAGASIPGILTRWSEHVRELCRHDSGTLDPTKQRRRYSQLLNRHCTSCLNCLVLEDAHSNDINAAEAKAISIVAPNANRFAEGVRSRRGNPRKPNRQPRARKSQSSRKRARGAQLRGREDHWGDDVNEHDRGFKNAAINND